MSELYGQEWARALCHELGIGSYHVGSFASAIVKAALAADSSNLAAIGQGFPELWAAVAEWRRFGHGYLMALAAGDIDAMSDAMDTWQERNVADHERQLARMEG